MVSMHRWYFGDLSYLEAEKLLVQPGLRRGTFLLRNSTSHPGCLALSVRSEAKIYHYLIHIKQDGGKHSYYYFILAQSVDVCACVCVCGVCVCVCGGGGGGGGGSRD